MRSLLSSLAPLAALLAAGASCTTPAQRRAEQGALYPALHRLEAQGLVSARWGISENKRKAKYYELTEAGHQRLRSDHQQWRKLVSAMEAVLNSAMPEVQR